MGVAELPLDGRRVDVATILREKKTEREQPCFPPCPSLKQQTYHLRVFGISKSARGRISLLRATALAGDRVGDERSLLNERRSSDGARRGSEGRDPHNLTGQHLSPGVNSWRPVSSIQLRLTLASVMARSAN